MKKIIGLVFMLFLLGIGSLFYITFGSHDQVIVNLALQKEGKTYLFSKLNHVAITHQISQNQSPMIIPYLRLFIDADKLYAEPLAIKELASLLGGEYQVYEKKEQSYEGYISTEGKKHYTLTTSNQSTAKIGEQLISYTITLKNAANESKTISWTQKGMTLDRKAIKNCKLKSFNIKSNPYPGQTVVSSQEFIVVQLSDIVAFFGHKTTINLDQDNQLLYLAEAN